jgi:hypothetical protein
MVARAVADSVSALGGFVVNRRVPSAAGRGFERLLTFA